jgi:hypothetical protein
LLGYQVRQFSIQNIPPAACNLVLIGRYVLERRNAVKDVMPIDGGNFGDVFVA